MFPKFTMLVAMLLVEYSRRNVNNLFSHRILPEALVSPTANLHWYGLISLSNKLTVCNPLMVKRWERLFSDCLAFLNVVFKLGWKIDDSLRRYTDLVINKIISGVRRVHSTLLACIPRSARLQCTDPGRTYTHENLRNREMYHVTTRFLCTNPRDRSFNLD